MTGSRTTLTGKAFTISSDTIAAVSTALGASGISIVRISGGDALRLADRVVRCHGLPPSQRRPGTFLHGFIRGTARNGVPEDVDEAIVLVYHAPHSYTTENTIEIQGHGGRAAAARILRAVLDAGARLAQPGEFTRRAFLNGRIDLVQAEAVMDLIQARSERAAEAALQQIEGRLSAFLIDIYDTLVSTAADLEASLDFDENELPARVMNDILGRLEAVHTQLSDLLATWDEGHLLREGARIVIGGQPNVGKSTLLNELLQTRRSIVTDIPGTTRDTIEEQIVIGGVPVRIVDTAGLRESECLIEREGIERAREAMRRADVVLYVLDASKVPSPEDQAAIGSFDPRRVILVLNKSDLGLRVRADAFLPLRAVECSLLNRANIEDVRTAVQEVLGIHESAPAHAVISERHRGLVLSAMRDVENARNLLAARQEEDLLPGAEHVRGALEALGMIVGKVYTDEILDRIFSRFCVGK